MVGVYDFGGGTFDFSVVDITADHFRVLGFAGDAWLGGDDFDVAMAEALANAFWRQNGVELRERAVEWQRLLEACEVTKRALSREAAAVLTLEAIVERPQRIDLRQTVQRSILEQLTRPLVDRSLVLCRQVLERLGLEAQDLTQVIVTGGITRLPFVREAVARAFGRPIPTVVHPDEAVGLGAGLRAAQIAGHHVAGVGSPVAEAAAP
ncbi:MAG: Hsp70 family protein [Myxococcales bacterium]